MSRNFLPSPPSPLSQRERGRIALVFSFFFLACAGSGEIAVQETPSASVITDCLTFSQGTRYQISGYARYEQPQFKNTSVYLDLASPTIATKPIRQAIVQVIDTTADKVIATANADNAGYFSLKYNETQGGKIKVRVMARTYANAQNSLYKSSDKCNIFLSVLDNTAGAALYSLSSGEIAQGTPSLNLTASHNTQTRTSAVFSVLDTALESANTILAAKSDIVFKPLNLYWSVNNTNVSGNIRTGLIGTTYFGPDIFSTAAQMAVYILGKANVDTDEYDVGVIAHEFGHYLEYSVYRWESIGGPHGISSRVDLSLAFSEAWGNFFGSVVRQNSLFVDSNGLNNTSGLNIQLETQPGDNIYNETSVQAALWDIYDGAGDEAANCGLAPISNAFYLTRIIAGPMSYMTFAYALQSQNPSCLNGALAGIHTALGSGAVGVTDPFTITNPPAPACRNQIFTAAAIPLSPVAYAMDLTFSSGGVNNYCAAKWIRVTGNGSVRTVSLTGVTAGCDLDLFIMDGPILHAVAANTATGTAETISNFTFKNSYSYDIRVYTKSASVAVCNYTLSIA